MGRKGLEVARVVSLVALGSFFAPAAAAEPPPLPATVPTPDTTDPRIEEARDAFRTASALANQGQWAEALSAFARSSRLRPHTITTYNIGFCERALGHLTRARRSFANALAPSDIEPLPEDLATEARAYMAEIDGHLSRAVIMLSPRGAGVAVDGRPLEEGGASELIAGTRDPGPPEPVATPSFNLVLDPGLHVITVRTPGAADAIVTQEFAPGTVVSLTLGPPFDLVQTPLSPPQPDKHPVPATRIAAGIAFGVGGVSAIVAAVFGARAISEKGSLNGVCLRNGQLTPSQCPETAQSTISSMNTFANASTAGVALAIVGVAAGTTLLVIDLRRRAPGADVRVGVGSTGAGLAGSF
jgi:hypothetical protein